MEIFKGFYLLKKLILLIFILFAGSLSAFSADNTISGIDVRQVNGNQYQIFLKVNRTPVIKKDIDNEGNLSVILNKTLPSDSIEINYDNTPDIQNIIVQKKNNNSLVLIQGQNISNSKLYVKDLSTGSVKPVKNQNISIFDGKTIIFSIIGLLLLVFGTFSSKNKTKKSNEVAKANLQRIRKSSNANTLRNKNLTQSGRIPSIGYAVNGSFNSANYYMTKPDEYSVNNEINEEEIRKVG